MNQPIENLISKFVEGTLTPEEKVTFDRVFESDAAFSAKTLEALGKRLGPAPEAFLDRMGNSAKPAVEEAFHRKMVPLVKETVGSGWSIPWSVIVPVSVLLAGLLGLVAAAKYLVQSGQDRDASTLRIESVAAPIAGTERSIEDQKIDHKKVSPDAIRAKAPSRAKHPVSQTKTQEGHLVRFENLPVSSHLTIEVLDAKGKCVKHLYDGAWAEGQRLDWDGHADDGKAVTPGAYQARVKSQRGMYTSRFTVQ